MKIEDLVPLTNGLSLTACGQTLVCDRASIVAVRNDAIDVKFLIAGTGFVPRLRLTRARILKTSADELARVVRRVAQVAVGCEGR